MGRRSFISVSTINRIMSASRQKQRERERNELISRNGTGAKELTPTYTVKSVDFNEGTRITKIEILQSQQYRTIDRYVTQNYVRHPIYSGWKTKTKIIKKTIKLTNQELENLDENPDPLIQTLAKEIIEKIGNEELYPSWFIRFFIVKLYGELLESLENEKIEFISSKNRQINETKRKISSIQEEIKKESLALKKLSAKKEKLDRKVKKGSLAKKSIIKNIFTLYIYAYYTSTKRKKKLLKRETVLSESIQSIHNRLSKMESTIESHKKEIDDLRQKQLEKEQEIEKRRDREYAKYLKQMKEVQPLQCELQEDKAFTLLKKVCGFEYQKIIGCYVIHNRENDKYYVGQSKDIIKRLKQHFKGTIPNNVIFAEDYYSTPVEKREDLFEVKIIPCQTKDELDRTEKKLIEDYNSYLTGYNGTNGNS